jgi:ERF superfamily.
MNVHEAIINVMGDIGHIGKDQHNRQQNYAYRGIEDVMNALQPLLIKHKLAIIPSVQEIRREERSSKSGGVIMHSIATVQYTFMAEDGSTIVVTVVGEGMDSGDKSVNKALSSAYKYACFQAFCIPTEELVDSETETHEPDVRSAKGPAMPKYICVDCGNMLQPYTNKDGREVGIDELEKLTVDSFGKALCIKCAKKQKAV